MSFRTLLNNRCDVHRVTEIRDSMGNAVTSWAVLHHAIPCRIQPVSGRELLEWDKLGVTITNKMFCETGNSFTEKDRVAFNGNVYQIRAVRNVDEMNHHLEILLEHVDKGTVITTIPAGGFGIGGFGGP